MEAYGEVLWDHGHLLEWIFLGSDCVISFWRRLSFSSLETSLVVCPCVRKYCLLNSERGCQNINLFVLCYGFRNMPRHERYT